jgi:hypothetical protein
MDIPHYNSPRFEGQQNTPWRFVMKKGSNRSASGRGKSKKIYVLIPVFLLIVLSIVIFILYINGFFYNRKAVQIKDDTSKQEIAALAQASKIVPSDMLSKTLSLLSKQTQTSPYVVSWYALPGSISSVTALSSEYIVTTDQVNLLRYYIKVGNKDAAKELAERIQKDLTSENGCLVPERKITDIASLSSSRPVFPANTDYEELPVVTEYSSEATVEYLHALLEYYTKWGQAADWDQIQKLAALIYTDNGTFSEDLTITALPSTIPTGPDQDVVSAVDGQISTGGSYTAVSLSSLDLEVFRMLSSVDAKYQPMYDKALSILEGAQISDNLPLYAVGFSQSSSGYSYYFADSTQADLVSSLKVTLYLAQEGAASQKTLLWIKEQLYNQGMIYKSYDLISGQASSSDECIEAYGIILQIARAVDDSDLYSKALDRLEWNLATSSTSAAKSALFRQPDSSRVVVYAKDNLSALLGA